MQNGSLSRELRRRVLRIGVYLGVGNFLIFILGALYLGGYALCGCSTDGHYFVSARGQLNEVSHAAFVYSLWHGRSVLLTHPVALICAWIAHRMRQNPT
jgi:hypothetical protein